MRSIYLWYSVGRSPTMGPTMREAPRPPPALEQPAGRGFPANVGATRRAPRGDTEQRTTARTPAGAAWTPGASPRTYRLIPRDPRGNAPVRPGGLVEGRRVTKPKWYKAAPPLQQRSGREFWCFGADSTCRRGDHHERRP